MMPRKSKSPSKAKKVLEEGSIKFCHYKNGMFMGQMKCFERSGKGIVFLDTGQVALASYQKDKLEGDTLLITKNNILYSLKYHHDNLLELVAQSRDKIFFVKFKYGQPNGQGIVIDFEKQDIFYLVYRQGRIIKKSIQQDPVFINRVFSHNNISTLIPVAHLKMLNFEFKFPFLQVMRKNSLITIGFYKEGSLNGLGFVLFKDSDKQKGFYELLEKGYYKQSLLSGIGQKRYQNGNLYIGQFKNNLFQGRGLLFNTEKNNWVKGMFKDGNLVDMIEYSNEGDFNSPKIVQMLSALHRKKSSWVNSDLRLHNQMKFNIFLQKEIKNITQSKLQDIMNYQEKKEIVLKRIQNNFVPDNAHTELVKQSSVMKWEDQKRQGTSSRRKSYNALSNKKKSTQIILKTPPKSNNKSKSKSTKKPQLFKIRTNNVKSYNNILPKDQQQEEQNQQWKLATAQVPINIYTFQQSSQSPRFSLSQSKNTTFNIHSNIHKFNFSVNKQQVQPFDGESKRSISASRRHKIFQNSPSKLSNSSRRAFPSPSKSTIRESIPNYEQNSVSDVLQQIRPSLKKSNKMVKSRIFQNDQQSLPSFKYSRFKPEQQSSIKHSKYSKY